MPLDFAALLLADGRFPTGSHAHSFGLEAAVGAGMVSDVAGLRQWMLGCLHTVWLLDAAAAIQATGLCQRYRDPVGHARDWAALDGELSARIVSAPARRVSRTLGRQLLRTGRAVWPHPGLDHAVAEPRGPLAPLALGAIATAAGLGVVDAATISLHHATQGAAAAAIRLLGLDPYATAALMASLGPQLKATCLMASATGPDPADLPSAGAPMLDVLFGMHDVADGRLFAS